MIFVDANVILRSLTRPMDEKAQMHQEYAATLFRLARRGDLQFTTSDAVLAEVAFILTAPKHYQRPVADAAALISTIIRLRGFRHPNKRVLHRSLELWADNPQLGFVDALTATYGRSTGMILATFDSDFDSLADIVRWQPS